MLDRYEQYIYSSGFGCYMRSKMIKHNKDLFECVGDTFALLEKLAHLLTGVPATTRREGRLSGGRGDVLLGLPGHAFPLSFGGTRVACPGVRVRRHNFPLCDAPEDRRLPPGAPGAHLSSCSTQSHQISSPRRAG